MRSDVLPDLGAHAEVPWGGIWWLSMNYFLINWPPSPLCSFPSMSGRRWARCRSMMGLRNPSTWLGTDGLWRFTEPRPSACRILNSRGKAGMAGRRSGKIPSAGNSVLWPLCSRMGREMGAPGKDFRATSCVFLPTKLYMSWGQEPAQDFCIFLSIWRRALHAGNAL